MIDQREKSHRAENFVSWTYSSVFAATTATHHTANDVPNWWTRRSNQFGVEATTTTARKSSVMVGGCVFDS
jgi:hypothetical protein